MHLTWYCTFTATHLIFQKMKPKAGLGNLLHGQQQQNRQKNSQTAQFLIISKVLKHVMSSAAEIEIGAVFHKRQRRSSPQDNIEGIGAPTAPHTNGDG
jgi:hypothetical protein